MDFKIAREIVQSIISAVENSAVASVRAIKSHTFVSRVTNFPKVQDVKGTVVVGNQKNVEKKLEELAKAVYKIPPVIIPKAFEVTNFPKTEKIEIPKTVEVSNFPKAEPPPKTIEVSNQPTKELDSIRDQVGKVEKAVRGLKLDPMIRVEAPKAERVVVPAPQVTVNEKEINYEKMADAIAEQMPEGIDYKKMADAVGKKIAGMMIVSGGGGGRSDVKIKESVLPVGAATLEKQDSQITLGTMFNSLTESLHELIARLAPLGSAMSAGAPSLRVTGIAMPSTAVTGPITSANSIAEKAVGGMMHTMRVAQENLTAIQSNIINCIGV